MRKQLLLALTMIALISTGILSPAKALTVQMPEQWENFPYCTDADANQMCVASFEVDDDNDGNFDAISPMAELSVSAYLFDIKENDVASLAVYVFYNGSQDLSPSLPTGSQISIEINTRDWRPNPQAFSTAKIDSFRQEKVDGEWITHGLITTKTYSIKMDEDQGGLILDQPSQANLILWGDEYRDAFSAAFDGMWTSSNATTTISPVYDENTMTWTIDTSGPALNGQGSANIAYFNSFFPDAALISVYGADPASMVGIFKVLRKDGNTIVEQEVIITRVTEPVAGVLIEIPAYSFNSNRTFQPLSGISSQLSPLAKNFRSPTHVIKPKVKLLKAAKLNSVTKSGNSALLKGSKVSGAKSYQGVCIKGSKLKYAMAKNPNLKVKNLSKGNWQCRIRGVKKVGGKWSNQIKVKIS